MFVTEITPTVSASVECEALPAAQKGTRARSRTGEIAVLAVFSLLLLLMRLAYVWMLRVDSDEPQHLHVVWCWTQGLVQYLNIFDNHTPLFQLLMAPVLSLVGERADVMVWMRMAVTPLYFGTLGCVYLLASRLYSRRAGIWAAILTGVCPTFMVTASEFRTDDLWVLAWMATLLAALGSPGALTRWRVFVASVLLGITFSASMKTSLLLVSLLIAVAITLAFRAGDDGLPALAKRLAVFVPGIAGLLIVPGALLAYFATRHALPQLYECVIAHNAARGLAHKSLGRQAIVPGLLPVIIGVGWMLYRSAPVAVGFRRAIVFMTALIFTALMEGYWPLITPQNFLPVIPLFWIAAVPVLLAVSDRLREWGEAGNGLFWRRTAPALGLLLPSLIAAEEIGTTQCRQSVFHDRLAPFTATIGNILRLTHPGDTIMDGKGETIFRARPYYYVLEGVALYRMKHGAIQDTIRRDMEKKGTCVAVMNRIPAETREWIERTFVHLSERVCVAGSMLRPRRPGETGLITRLFEIPISSNYQIISASGTASGMLDGKPYPPEPGKAASVPLAPGNHTFQFAGAEPVAVIWAQSVEAGFSPFHRFSDYSAFATKEEL